jgi:hypothetical protein
MTESFKKQVKEFGSGEKIPERKDSVYEDHGVLAFDGDEIVELGSRGKILSCDAEYWGKSYGMSVEEVISKWPEKFNPDGSLKVEIKKMSLRG